MADAKIILSAVDQTKAAVDAARRNLGSLSDTAGAVSARFGTLGLAISGAFTAVTMKGAIDALDMLDDLSEKTGIAVESLSGLRYAGEVTGTPVEALATGVRKLSVTMTEAAAGNKQAAGWFKALGVEIKNSDGSLRGMDDVLGDVADRFASYADGAAKSALAQEGFGKSGAELIPLLNQGSSGIRALRQEAEALGAVYGGDLAKSAAAFNDNLKRLELNAEAAKVSLLSGLLPALNKVIEGYIRMREAGVVGAVAKDAAKDVFGFGQMTDNPGQDLERLKRQQLQINSRRAFAQRKGLPVDGFDAELEDLSRLMEASRIRQRQQALGGLGDTSDAQSRRMAAGRKVATPVVPSGAGGGGKSPAKQEAEERRRLLAELSGVQGDYIEQLSRLNAMRAAGNIGEERYVALVVQLIEKQPMAKKLMDEAAKSEKDLAEAKQKTTEMQDRYLAGLAADNESIAQRNASLAQEIEELGLTADALDVLREMRLQSNIERERENLLAAQNIEGNEAEVAQIERRIALLERQLGLQQQLSGKRVELGIKEQGQKESEEFSSTLRDDVKGALQRAFEDSRNPAEAFSRALASTLYTRVSTALAKAASDALLAKMGLGGSGGGFNFGASIAEAFGAGNYGGYGSSGGGGFGTGSAFGNMDYGAFLHSGGIAGSEASFRRAVSTSVFHRAPRYHTGGLAGDEVPAILKRGEGVFTQGQMKALGAAVGDGAGRGDFKLTIINPNGPPIQDVTQRRISDDERVLIINQAVKAVAAEFQTANSDVSRSLRSTHNVVRKR